MALKFKIVNADRLKVAIVAATRNYANAAFTTIERELEKTAEGIIKNIANSPEFQELKSSSTLRGQLGLATQGKKTGGDTDADDLLKQLRNFKLKKTRSFGVRRFNLEMPTLRQLSKRLTHRLTVVRGGTVGSGPKSSWFDLWEFGDRGQITTLTVFKKSAGSAAAKIGVSRTSLNSLISKRSRSGQAIQLISQPANSQSSIVARNLVGTVYNNFGRIVPARVGKAIKEFTKNNKPNSFFARIFR